MLFVAVKMVSGHYFDFTWDVPHLLPIDRLLL